MSTIEKFERRILLALRSAIPAATIATSRSLDADAVRQAMDKLRNPTYQRAGDE
jgi:hypothetical protein